MNDRKSEPYDGPDRRRLTQKGVFSRAVNGLIARHVIDERKTDRELLAAAHEQNARVQLQLEDATDDVASLSVERSDLADEVKTLRYEIAKVRADTIEECAKVCDRIANGANGAKKLGAPHQSIEQVIWTCEDLAKAIRGLQEKAK